MQATLQAEVDPSPDTGAAAWPWEEMISEFRALGGVANNVRLGQGPIGRGVFAVDPASPIEIVVPANLLFALKEVEFTPDGVLRATDAAPQGAGEKAFFARYMAEYDWGPARPECEEFLRELDAAPEPVRAYLREHFEFADSLEGDVETRARSRFLKTRIISWRDAFVLMPVLDLVNHGAKAPGFAVQEEGISMAGSFSDEVRVRYNVSDPMGMFQNWGFVGEELAAFSVHMRLTLNDRAFAIRRELRKKTLIGEFLTPALTEENGLTTISYLMIGNADFPRLSKGIFYRLMRDQGLGDQAEEAFDHILHHNRTVFFNLLALLEEHEGPMIKTLRRMCRRQLESMSYSLGVRQV